MAFTYPLTPPTSPGFVEINFMPWTVVGYHESPTSRIGQTYEWPGSGWAFEAPLPPMTLTQADAWIGFLLGLNGRRGTFLFGDQSRPTTRGTASGSWAVGSGNSANITTLVTQAGTGAFVVGDWLQIGVYLHKVTKVNSATNYEIFPRLRTAYTNGTAITYSNAKGIFRLTENSVMNWKVNAVKHVGLELKGVEALA